MPRMDESVLMPSLLPFLPGLSYSSTPSTCLLPSSHLPVAVPRTARTLSSHLNLILSHQDSSTHTCNPGVSSFVYSLIIVLLLAVPLLFSSLGTRAAARRLFRMVVSGGSGTRKRMRLTSFAVFLLVLVLLTW